MNNDTFVEPPCVLLLSIWFRVWNPGFVKYLKMRSSEVHNITLFLIRKKSRNFRATGYGLHSNAFRTTQSAHSAVVDERQKSQIEKRKRNVKTISPISRGEREIWISFPNFERRKRNQTKCSQLSRREREIRQNVLNFREEKEKSMFFAQASRVEKILDTFFQFWEENI